MEHPTSESGVIESPLPRPIRADDPRHPDYIPRSMQKEWVVQDDHLFIHHHENVDAELKRIKYLRDNAEQTKAGDWYHAAEIPETVYYGWIFEAGLKLHQRREITELVIKKLNDPAWKHLRVRTGKLRKQQ